MLHALVARSGHLLTKETLFAGVWPGTTVSETVLTVAIRELRRVLGDQAQQAVDAKTQAVPVALALLCHLWVNALGRATNLAAACRRFAAQPRAALHPLGITLENYMTLGLPCNA